MFIADYPKEIHTYKSDNADFMAILLSCARVRI